MPCTVCKDEKEIQAEHGTVKCPWCKKPEEGQGGPFVPARERMGPVPSQSRRDSGCSLGAPPNSVAVVPKKAPAASWPSL